MPCWIWHRHSKKMTVAFSIGSLLNVPTQSNLEPSWFGLGQQLWTALKLGDFHAWRSGSTQHLPHRDSSCQNQCSGGRRPSPRRQRLTVTTGLAEKPKSLRRAKRAERGVRYAAKTTKKNSISMASAVLEKTPVSGCTPPVVSVRLTQTQRLMNDN